MALSIDLWPGDYFETKRKNIKILVHWRFHIRGHSLGVHNFRKALVEMSKK